MNVAVIRTLLWVPDVYARILLSRAFSSSFLYLLSLRIQAEEFLWIQVNFRFRPYGFITLYLFTVLSHGFKKQGAS